MDNTNNFLKAIKKHSEQEREQMIKEMNELRNKELAKAEAESKAEAERYSEKLISAQKNKVAGQYAVKNLEAQAELFKKRQAMLEKIIEGCEKKLLDFTRTPAYKDKLVRYAQEIDGLFSGSKFVLYLKPDDAQFADELKSKFNSCTEITVDPKIRLGGLRGECDEKKLVADNTLDSKLEQERAAFIETADLRI